MTNKCWNRTMYLVNEDKKTLSSGEDFFTDSMKYKKIGAL